MKCKKNILFLTIIILSLNSISGCKKNNSINSSLTYSESSSVIEVETLQEAINNTQEYAVTSSVRLGDGWYFEVMLDNMYYYDPSNEGYIVLDNDSDYIHNFSMNRLVDDQGMFDYEMVVHGRRGIKEQLSLFYTSRLIDILDLYADDFQKKSTNMFYCNVASLGRQLENYLQSKSLSYSNYFEIKVNDEGKISNIYVYEKSNNNYQALVIELVLESITLQDYKPYKKWYDKGQKIDLLIYDLKHGYFVDSTNYYAVYQNEEVEIIGTVVAIDNERNVYIANQDASNGPVGIKVQLKDSENIPSIKEIVQVKGTIKLAEYTPFISNASIVKTGQYQSYVPTFDEETLVDANGGGVYAVNLFMNAPYFADSLYSTYAYINKVPNSNVVGEDTKIELVCPTFSTETGEKFKMELILPKEMSATKRDEYLNALKTFGIYNYMGVEVSLKNVLIKFDFYYETRVVLEVTDSSILSKKLTAQEKLSEFTGIDDFPTIESEKHSCYSFGGSTGLFLEDLYGVESTYREGVFFNGIGITTEKVDNYIATLEEIGFTLYDIVKAQLTKHTILKNGDIVIDITIQDVLYGEDKNLMMWVYKGNVIQGKTIETIIQESVGSFFDINDFVKLEGTYDANYAHYGLLNYAGRDFDVDNPLHVITLDVNEDYFKNLRDAYLAKGYKYWRLEDNTMYTYKTRGQNHYVLYKQIENSDENIFVDLATYPTTDYTYSGHSEFTYRIEILIYKDINPLSTLYETNLDNFIDCYVERTFEQASFEVNLPEGVQIERLKKLNSDFINYGYYYVDEVFIYYNNLDEIRSSIINGLEQAGYILSSVGSKSETYMKTNEDNSLSNAFITILVEKDKGYIRLFEGIAGIDF